MKPIKKVWFDDYTLLWTFRHHQWMDRNRLIFSLDFVKECGLFPDFDEILKH